MPRKPDVVRPTLLHVSLPEDVRARLDLALFSELEGRVPKGAYQRFFIERIQEFFGWRRLDLAPFGFPQGFFVSGPREMLDHVETRLKGVTNVTNT